MANTIRESLPEIFFIWVAVKKGQDSKRVDWFSLISAVVPSICHKEGSRSQQSNHRHNENPLVPNALCHPAKMGFFMTVCARKRRTLRGRSSKCSWESWLSLRLYSSLLYSRKKRGSSMWLI